MNRQDYKRMSAELEVSKRVSTELSKVLCETSDWAMGVICSATKEKKECFNDCPDCARRYFEGVIRRERGKIWHCIHRSA
jgi:hypothetical protein